MEAIVNNTIAVLDGIQQQWLCAPGSFSMVAQFRTFIESIKTNWGSRQQGSFA